MNQEAEKLTGWTLHESRGKRIAEVFRIVNEQTLQQVENPVDKVRSFNRVMGLAKSHDLNQQKWPRPCNRRQRRADFWP